MRSVLNYHRNMPSVRAPRRPFSRIVVAVDTSEASERAVSLAISLARGDTRVDLVFCHAIDVPRMMARADHLAGDYGLSLETARREARELLDRCIIAAEKADVFGRQYVRYGAPASEVTMLAGVLAADLIVIGRRRHDPIHRILNGSVADDIVRTSSLPVLVAGANGSEPPALHGGFVLAELADESELSAPVKSASAVASAYGADLVCLSGAKSSRARSEAVERAIRELQPALFVIGATSQQRWRDRFLPNMLKRMLQMVSAPVLVVRN
jgi:nucleotide-binding universal stress UspA family protein